MFLIYNCNISPDSISGLFNTCLTLLHIPSLCSNHLSRIEVRTSDSFLGRYFQFKVNLEDLLSSVILLRNLPQYLSESGYKALKATES